VDATPYAFSKNGRCCGAWKRRKNQAGRDQEWAQRFDGAATAFITGVVRKRTPADCTRVQKRIEMSLAEDHAGLGRVRVTARRVAKAKLQSSHPF
jgi:hypothetical protein